MINWKANVKDGIMKKILSLLLVFSIIFPMSKDDGDTAKPVFTYGIDTNYYSWIWQDKLELHITQLIYILI